MPTLFEHAGGEEALHRLEQVFYDSVLADPLLQPLFGAGRPDHVDHLTAFTAESFGGPDRFSRELGFAHLISVHRGLKISEDAEIVALLHAAAKEQLGEAPAIGGASYWADAAFIAAAGIPAAVFGPAGDGAHATEEWVSLSSTDAVARTLLALAARICA